MPQALKLLATSFTKDVFFATVPPMAARHVLPKLPGNSPFTSAIVERQVIFIHVPKAAGSSVKTALYGNSAGGHRRIAEFYAYDPDRAAAFFKFGFVRNPWSRLLSAYSYLTQGKGTSGRDRRFTRDFLSGHDNFASFVEALEEPRYRRVIQSYDHFRPQVHWLCRPRRRQHAMDFLGRFETLATDLTELEALLSLKLQSGEHLRSSNHEDYREAYSIRTRSIVEDVYARDIAVFGYRFASA